MTHLERKRGVGVRYFFNAATSPFPLWPPVGGPCPCVFAPWRLCVEMGFPKNPYKTRTKSDHFREREFFTHVKSTTYNFNALKCTDFRKPPSGNIRNFPESLPAANPDESGRFPISPDSNHAVPTTYADRLSNRPDAFPRARRRSLSLGLWRRSLSPLGDFAPLLSHHPAIL
jgi:hypothetical protein